MTRDPQASVKKAVALIEQLGFEVEGDTEPYRFPAGGPSEISFWISGIFELYYRQDEETGYYKFVCGYVHSGNTADRVTTWKGMKAHFESEAEFRSNRRAERGD